MSIQLVHDDSPVSVQYCAECETRQWLRDGEPVGFENIVPASQLRDRPRRR